MTGSRWLQAPYLLWTGTRRYRAAQLAQSDRDPILNLSYLARFVPAVALVLLGSACQVNKPGGRTNGAGGAADPLVPNASAAVPTAPVPVQDTGTGPRHFKHVILIVLENEGLHRALAVPYFAALTKQGAWFSNYHAVGHPSYPNYLALISGSTLGFTSDTQGDPLDGPTIADQLEARGLTWKQYAEDYPGNCFRGNTAGGMYLNSFAHGIIGHPYARKHVPFLSFASIQNNPKRCARVVDGDQFMRDARGDSLPNYSFYTPNMRHDGHDTPIDTAANWLRGFLGRLQALPAMHDSTLVVVTFDEGIPPEYSENTVLTVMLADSIAPGEYKQRVTHYGLLRSIENNFGLSPISAGDRDATPIPETVWRK